MKLLAIAFLLNLYSCTSSLKYKDSIKDCLINTIDTRAFSYIIKNHPSVEIFYDQVEAIKDGIVVYRIVNGNTKIFAFKKDESDINSLFNVINNKVVSLNKEDGLLFEEVLLETYDVSNDNNYFIQCGSVSSHNPLYICVLKQENKIVLKYITLGDLIMFDDVSLPAKLNKSIAINTLIYGNIW